MRRRHLHRPFAIGLMFLVFIAPVAGRQGEFTLKVDVSLIPVDAAVYIEAESRSSQYVSPAKRVRNPGPNARGWSWKVRAQRANGEWGPWSESRAFDVFVNEPLP